MCKIRKNSIKSLAFGATFLPFLFFSQSLSICQTAKATSQNSKAIGFYSLPFQLRPISPSELIRVDSTFSAYEDNQNRTGGRAVSTVVAGGVKLREDLGLLLRMGNIANDPPSGAKRGISPINPMVGLLYSKPLENAWKAAFFLGAAFPFGAGGGNSANGGSRTANQAGILSRSALDNAMFAANYFTIAPGVGLAKLNENWTFQAEVTILQLLRTRGKNVDLDSVRFNSTGGLAFGYKVTPSFALLSEIRYQRWLMNRTVTHSKSPAIHNLTYGVGPRFSLKFGNTLLRPGVAFIGGVLGTISKGGYTYPYHSFKTIFLDIPIIFL